MNGRNAKRLRKVASVTRASQESRTYRGIESTLRKKVHKNLEGEIVSFIMTSTYRLNPSPRLLYKQLKSAYKRLSR